MTLTSFEPILPACIVELDEDKQVAVCSRGQGIADSDVANAVDDNVWIGEAMEGACGPEGIVGCADRRREASANRRPAVWVEFVEAGVACECDADDGAGAALEENEVVAGDDAERRDAVDGEARFNRFLARE